MAARCAADNRAAARDARAEAASVAAEGGDGLRAYLKQRGALRGRRRRVDMNYAGMADRTDTTLNALMASNREVLIM
jgi:hypothetical protein